MKRSIFMGALCLLVMACSTTKPTASSTNQPSSTEVSTSDPAQEEMNQLVLSIMQQARQAPPEPPIAEIMPPNFQSDGLLEKEATFRDYTLRIYKNTNTFESLFEILQGNKRLYAKTGNSFMVNETFEGFDNERAFPMGMEITGDGQPNLLVLEYTGGAHCCLRYHIFEIGKRFRAIAVIDAADSTAVFEDLDNDGKLEVEIGDWTYAYQFTCFIDSPVERVVLRYKDDGYFVAPDLMYKPAPTEDELQKKARKAKAVYEKTKANPGTWGSPAGLWVEMLNLIYTGHEPLAYKFFEMAWPAEITGKDAALAKFKKVLLLSPFYREMKGIGQSQQEPITVH